MKRISLIFTLLTLILLAAALPVSADSFSLSGTISAANLLPNGRLGDNSNTCLTLNNAVFYYDLIEFTPAASGTYYYIDVGYLSGDPTYIDTWIAIYTGSAATFDPSDPAGNGCFANIDDAGSLTLTGGVTYTIMVSSYTSGDTGTYYFYLSNEPYYHADTITAGTPLTGGRWDDDSASCTSLNGNPNYYFVSTTYTPSVSGYYIYLDGRYDYGTIDIWLAIFNGPFDPANPLVNCIANFDDSGVVYLEAGVTYTIVMSSYSSGNTGAASFLLFGPSGSATVTPHCPRPLPSGSVVYSVPAGARPSGGRISPRRPT